MTVRAATSAQAETAPPIRAGPDRRRLGGPQLPPDRLSLTLMKDPEMSEKPLHDVKIAHHSRELLLGRNPHFFVLGQYGSATLPGLLVGLDTPCGLIRRMKALPYAGKNARNGQLLRYQNRIGGKIQFSDGVIALKCPTKHDPEKVDAAFHRYFQEGFGIGKFWTHISFVELTREDISEIGGFAAGIDFGDRSDGDNAGNFPDDAAFSDESEEQDAAGNRSGMRLH